MKSMAELVKSKLIRYVGVSNFSAKRMRKAHEELRDHGLELVSNQVKFNLLSRKIESNGVLDTARELGISIIAYSPLSQGVLSGKFHDRPELLKRLLGFRKYMPEFRKENLKRSRSVIRALGELAGMYQVTPSQIALNWVVHANGESVVAIPGSTTPQQAEENTAVMPFVLKADEIDYLNSVSSAHK
jgi:aryl-alcohol dehydrogenase-like predicted oxidoreductase